MATGERLISDLQALTRRDGRVPGLRRFRAETGVTEIALHRAGFARYSELVWAAGLTPATFKQDALPDDDVFRFLAELSRRLNRFATYRDRLYQDS